MHPPEMDMSSVAFVERAADWAARLEKHEADSAGLPLSEARPVVARKLGVAPGTLENLRRGRLKGIGAHIYEALHRATMRRLQAELQRLQHELHLLTATGEDPRSDETAAVVADLAEVRKALGLDAAATTDD